MEIPVFRGYRMLYFRLGLLSWLALCATGIAHPEQGSAESSQG